MILMMMTLFAEIISGYALMIKVANGILLVQRLPGNVGMIEDIVIIAMYRVSKFPY
jgi:hypothetical protein